MMKKQDILEKLEYELQLWRRGVRHVAGVDEAGRGPIAGPVVAAAVILPPGIPDSLPARIADSKQLSVRQRERAYALIIRRALGFAVGIVSAAEIDRINIRNAAFQAMLRAIADLPVQPHHLLIDGHPLPDPPYPQTALVKGDDLSMSISAASIVAKVVRDQIMREYHREYPAYGFTRNKGYGTQQHIAAIRTHGYCPIHRRSFRLRQFEKDGVSQHERTTQTPR